MIILQIFKFHYPTTNCLNLSNLGDLIHSQPENIHSKKVAMVTPEDNQNCHHSKMIPKGIRLNLRNFHRISCDIAELLRSVPGGGEGDRPLR